MGSPALAVPGTLADCDIILSISEEGINRQFAELYKQEIRETDRLEAPPGLPDVGVAPPPKAQHLINHELQIHLAVEVAAGQSEIDYDSGIVGHIKSPTISFKDVGLNKARVTIEFQRDENAVQKDSLFIRWVGMGRKATLESETINGYKMSWEVDVGIVNIQNVMEELIVPAESKTSPETIAPKAIEALKPLANENFTIASIFCIFTAAQIASTFKLEAPGAKPATDAMHVAFMDKVSTYFSLLTAKIKPGRATPDHPFVLGYGLSQKLPTIASVQPGATPDSTPKYFIPKSYYVTVTPGGNDTHSNGTFNYCIMTHRDPDGEPKRAPEHSDPSKNHNAGKLDQTFFALTKTKEHDGIMGFARDLIFDKFLAREVASAFFIDIIEIFRKAMSKGNTSHEEFKTTWGGSGRTYQKEQTGSLDGKVTHTFLDDTQKVTGFSKLDVRFESDLQTDPNVSDADAKRAGRLVFTSQIKESFDYVDTGAFSDDSFYAHVDMIYKYVLDLAPGKGGLIDLTKNDAASSLPQYEDDGTTLKLTRRARNDGEYGAYFTTTHDLGTVSDIFDKLSKFLPEELAGAIAEFLERVVDAMEKAWAVDISKTIIAKYEDKWKAGITSLQNKIILPAGNVFSFVGVDVDDQGNMYTHVSYSQGAENVTRKDDDPATGETPNVGH